MVPKLDFFQQSIYVLIKPNVDFPDSNLRNN